MNTIVLSFSILCRCLRSSFFYLLVFILILGDSGEQQEAEVVRKVCTYIHTTTCRLHHYIF